MNSNILLCEFFLLLAKSSHSSICYLMPCILVLVSIGYMTLNKLLSLAKPQFPYFENGILRMSIS